MTEQPIHPTDRDRDAVERIMLHPARERDWAQALAEARAEGYEAGVHQGRSDALDVIERMIESDDPEAIVDALPRTEA